MLIGPGMSRTKSALGGCGDWGELWKAVGENGNWDKNMERQGFQTRQRSTSGTSEGELLGDARLTDGILEIPGEEGILKRFGTCV